MERLDISNIQGLIEPQQLKYIQKIELFDRIDSTNTYLLTHPQLPSGTICLAEEQLAGKGRRGQRWLSPNTGNIYLSLRWKFQKKLANLTALSLVIGIALLHTFDRYGIQEKFQLKWPNDILFAGQKVAGILLETDQHGSIIIGIGMNILMPESMRTMVQQAMTDLTEVAHDDIDRNRMTGILINELIQLLRTFEQHGLKPYLKEWYQQDYLLNKKIELSYGKVTLIGTVRGINIQGQLIIHDKNNVTHMVSSGTVRIIKK